MTTSTTSTTTTTTTEGDRKSRYRPNKLLKVTPFPRKKDAARVNFMLHNKDCTATLLDESNKTFAIKMLQKIKVLSSDADAKQPSISSLCDLLEYEFAQISNEVSDVNDCKSPISFATVLGKDGKTPVEITGGKKGANVIRVKLEGKYECYDALLLYRLLRADAAKRQRFTPFQLHRIEAMALESLGGFAACSQLSHFGAASCTKANARKKKKAGGGSEGDDDEKARRCEMNEPGLLASLARYVLPTSTFTGKFVGECYVRPDMVRYALDHAPDPTTPLEMMQAILFDLEYLQTVKDAGGKSALDFNSFKSLDDFVASENTDRTLRKRWHQIQAYKRYKVVESLMVFIDTHYKEEAKSFMQGFYTKWVTPDQIRDLAQAFGDAAEKLVEYAKSFASPSVQQALNAFDWVTFLQIDVTLADAEWIAFTINFALFIMQYTVTWWQWFLLYPEGRRMFLDVLQTKSVTAAVFKALVIVLALLSERTAGLGDPATELLKTAQDAVHASLGKGVWKVVKPGVTKLSSLSSLPSDTVFWETIQLIAKHLPASLRSQLKALIMTAVPPKIVAAIGTTVANQAEKTSSSS